MAEKTIAEAFRKRTYTRIIQDLTSIGLNREEREVIRGIIDGMEDDEVYRKSCDNESTNHYWENNQGGMNAKT